VVTPNKAGICLTVDVEEWFHAPDHPLGNDADLWPALEPVLPVALPKTLALLDRLGARATFFVLGWVAERYPDLVRSVSVAGHEVASHGWSHQRVDRMPPEAFRAEVRRSKRLLEVISGKRVLGFRAPCWSIGRDSWPYEILAEEGFLYSSSRLPIPGLGGARLAENASRKPIEFPALTRKIAGTACPAGGTVALRFMPEKWLRRAQDLRLASGQTAVYWFHPWELVEEGPRLGGGPLFTWARYTRLGILPKRLVALVPPGDRRIESLLGTPIH